MRSVVVSTEPKYNFKISCVHFEDVIEEYVNFAKEVGMTFDEDYIRNHWYDGADWANGCACYTIVDKERFCEQIEWLFESCEFANEEQLKRMTVVYENLPFDFVIIDG